MSKAAFVLLCAEIRGRLAEAHALVAQFDTIPHNRTERMWTPYGKMEWQALVGEGWSTVFVNVDGWALMIREKQ